MDVRTFGSWISAPKCLFFSRILSALTEVLGRDIRANDPRTSAGYPSQKLPLWADFSCLFYGVSRIWCFVSCQTETTDNLLEVPALLHSESPSRSEEKLSEFLWRTSKGGLQKGPEERGYVTNVKMCWPGPSAEMCRAFWLYIFWGIWAGIFLEDFSGHLLPQKRGETIRRLNPRGTPAAQK